MRVPSTLIVLVVVAGACGERPVDPGPACLDPPTGPAMARFADVTAASGVDFAYAATSFKGGALAVADLDGDALPDLVAARRGGGLAVYRNRGGLRFEPRLDSGLPADAAASAIAAADLDNDGDRDVVLATAGLTTVHANQGDGRFVEAARLVDAGTTEHVLPVDLDGDGLLDLYLGNYDLRGDPFTDNRLALNRGGLAFADAGVVGTGLTWTATAFDVDGDGDQDLYVANDTLVADHGGMTPPGPTFWPPDLVLRNDGPGPDGVPRFTDIAAAVGLATPRSSMGGMLADVDADGALDLYIPDFGAKKLFVRDAAGGFVDRAAELGLVATARRNATCVPGSGAESCLVLSWSAAFADFDLDGFDELLLVNGATYPGDVPPVLAFTRGRDLPYREVAPEIPCADARAMIATDLDADGDADVVLAHKDGPLAIHENVDAPAPGTWLAVTLRGRASNRDGIGARVLVRHASGRTQQRVVGAGGIVHAAAPAEAAFGIGGDRVTALEVHWPSGRRSELLAPAAGALVIDEP